MNERQKKRVEFLDVITETHIFCCGFYRSRICPQTHIANRL